jgi:hypothetical protein
VHAVVVREKMPQDMQIDQSEPRVCPDSSKTESVWRLGTLQPGVDKPIRISATPPAEGQMQTCLTLDYKPSLCRQANVVKPELQLERQVVDEEGRPREQFLACEDLFIEYRLTNVGSRIT